MKKTSLIFGILSIITMIGVIGDFIGMNFRGGLYLIFIITNPLFAAIGLITGIVAISKNKEGKPKSKAITGIILSGIAMLFILIILIKIINRGIDSRL